MHLKKSKKNEKLKLCKRFCKRIGIGIGIFILSLIISLVILEIILRVSYPLYADYNTEMWRYATYLKHMSPYPELGHEHLSNKAMFLYGTEIRTNSLGLRADKEYLVPKANGTKRIFILGDSITLGWGVNYSSTYPKLLETLLNENSSVKYEVINLGVGNYNAVNSLASLKKNIYLQPDIIIYGFYINDIEENRYPSKIAYFIKSKSYLYNFISDKIINIKYRKINYTEYYSDLYADYENVKKLNESVNGMIEVAENNSIPFVFLNIPEFHQIHDYKFSKINDLIKKEILNEKNITYMDLSIVFQDINVSSGTLWVSSEDPHPNYIAHRIIADNLYKELKKYHKNENISIYFNFLRQ